VRSALLKWFDQHQRDLPWRKTKDPYAIWVSEVMLQQTQVDRVKGYWARFLERFPTVKKLAVAEVSEVLSAWTGLGYYTRARNLHRAAQDIVKRFGAKLPDDLDALLSLPGFGRYTAGAVASIAFGREVPLVDGNVARVLSRLFEIEGAPADKKREAELWRVAGELVHGERPGDFNQALMELGATVCVPQNPLCLICPVKDECGALAHGRVDELPPARKATRRKKLELAVAVVRRGKTVLLARRVERGLFGGLWELPSIELTSGQRGTDLLQFLLGKRATIGPELHVFERTLTHRDLVLRVHPATLAPRLGKPPPGYVEWKWIAFEDRGELGMSSAMAKTIDEVLGL